MKDTVLGKNIKALREKSGMTQSELAKHLGLKQSAVSNIEKGWTKGLRHDTESKILSLFKVTRIELYGEKAEKEAKYSLFPLLTGKNYGKKSGFIYEVKNKETSLISLPFLGNVNFCAVATGDSMHNPSDNRSIKDGDYIGCIFANKNNVRYGEIYLLDTKDGVFIRELSEGVQDSFFVCTPLNKSYRPHKVYIEDINDIALVVGAFSIRFF